MCVHAISQSRAVGRTKCNEASSRSHTVIQLKVSRTTEHGVAIEGELNLVDLAGSEKIANSGVTGADTLRAFKQNIMHD